VFIQKEYRATTHIGKMRIQHRNLNEKCEGKRIFWRPRQRWEYNIKGDF
jgi:hypothetical protein